MTHVLYTNAQTRVVGYQTGGIQRFVSMRKVRKPVADNADNFMAAAVILATVLSPHASSFCPGPAEKEFNVLQLIGGFCFEG